MGKYETGGHTALPIWMDYMNAALKGRPNRDYPRPEGIVWVSMDPKTGKRAGDGSGISEPFRKGTEPASESDGSEAGPSTGDLMRSLDWYWGESDRSSLLSASSRSFKTSR